MKKMRKRHVSFVTGVLAAMMVFTLTPMQAYAATEDEIILNDETGIPDPELYQAILRTADGTVDGTRDGALSVAEAEKVTTLSCTAGGLLGGTPGNFIVSGEVKSLQGIGYLKNLTALSLYGNQLNNVNALSGLTNLTDLSLEKNQISDISGLSGLTNLTTLDLGSNKITDISALSALTNLTTLAVNHNPITNIDAMSGLTNLTSLYVNSTQISSIQVLSNLVKLENLGADVTPISDISALSGLTNLKSLTMGCCGNISDISPISNLTNLRNINMQECSISDISAFKNLTNLETIDLGANYVRDISALANLTNLEHLNLEANEISDVSALSGLKKLEGLNLYNNRITDFSPLAGLTCKIYGVDDQRETENNAKDDPTTGNTPSDDTTNDPTTKDDPTTGNTPSGDTTNGTTPKDDATTDPSAPTNTVTSNGDKNTTVTGAGNVLPTGATFTTKQLTEGNEYDNVVSIAANNLGKDAVYSVLQMDLNDANGNAMTQLNGYVQVSLPIPTTLNVPAGKTIVVYRCEDNGTLTRCNTTVKNGMVTFETNHFSYYILNVENTIEDAKENTTENQTADSTIYYILAGTETSSAHTTVTSPKTADTNTVLPFTLMLLGALGMTVALKKTKHSLK